jgi:GTP cyclohydrolase FolE2
MAINKVITKVHPGSRNTNKTHIQHIMQECYTCKKITNFWEAVFTRNTSVSYTLFTTCPCALPVRPECREVHTAHLPQRNRKEKGIQNNINITTKHI